MCCYGCRCVSLWMRPSVSIDAPACCQGQSTAIRTLVMHTMAEWYMRGEHHDQARLSRILDVAQDLKVTTSLSDLTDSLTHDLTHDLTMARGLASSMSVRTSRCDVTEDRTEDARQPMTSNWLITTKSAMKND